jgi:predicted secreted protein
MKWVALAMAAFYFIIWSYGGYIYSVIGGAQLYYILGWVVLFAYLPFYWYRTYVENPRDGALAAQTPAAGE